MERNDYIHIFNKFLENKATPSEIKLLIEWLKERKAFDKWADDIWMQSPMEMDPSVKQHLLDELRKQIFFKETGKRTFMSLSLPSLFHYALRITAIILLLITTSIVTYHYAMDKQREPMDMIVAVEKGQKANITLPDGSKGWINSDSKLSYGSRFNADERVLNLEGEAYFEVKPDAKRPFIVQSGKVSVKALGTSFNVKNYNTEEHISVVLMTGKVEVTANDNHVDLLPNEQAIFNKHSSILGKNRVDNSLDYSSWMYNTLNFESTPFSEIAHTLERYYNTQIVFKSEALKSYRFTGKPGNTSLASILHLLSLTSPLAYEIKDSVVILYENNDKKELYNRVLKQ